MAASTAASMAALTDARKVASMVASRASLTAVWMVVKKVAWLGLKTAETTVGHLV